MELSGPLLFRSGCFDTTGFVFKYWAWYWPGVHLLTKTPRLTGTWVGKLKSNYIHDGEVEPRGPIDVAMVVAQSVDGLNVRLYTQESYSTPWRHPFLRNLANDSCLLRST